MFPAVPTKLLPNYIFARTRVFDVLLVAFDWGSRGGLMGSSGSNRISDYPGSSSSSGKPGGSAGGGGDSTEDRCARAFSADLEDVEHSDYYQAHQALPPVATALEVVQRKRLIAQTTSGESVGNLPTSFNYLAACLKDGWRYVGTIQNATSGPPVARILADFAATPPR